MALFVTSDGRGVEVSARSRRKSLTREQVKRIRQADWLHDFEVGRFDPTTGKVEPRSIAMIAALAGVADNTVRAGLNEARRIRDAIESSVEE